MKSKEQKRNEAQIRKERSDALTIPQKLFNLSTRQGSSKKEAERLLKKLA